MAWEKNSDILGGFRRISLFSHYTPHRIYFKIYKASLNTRWSKRFNYNCNFLIARSGLRIYSVVVGVVVVLFIMVYGLANLSNGLIVPLSLLYKYLFPIGYTTILDHSA